MHSDSEATIIVTPLESDHENPNTPSSPPKLTPKGQFNTKTFGVKKGATKIPRKRKHNYPCKPYELNFSTMTEFNSHFKENHEPVICKVCSLSFNTQSTLKSHAYTHKELKYACPKCDKKFPFSSDRDVHMVSHDTEKKHVCATCNKDFFMKSDLTKHEKTHLQILWKCNQCEYSSTDERNLKAHQRTHSNLMPYMCSKCLSLFKFHTQWKRLTSKPCLKEGATDDLDSASTKY